MTTSIMDQLIRQAASRGRNVPFQNQNTDESTETLASRPPPPGNAGSGTGPGIPEGPPIDMNYIIRAIVLARRT